jgi:hypothetical protein
MARIRTIKPEFFRHEELQDLASEHGAEIMLVFAGLWGHCDKAGRFEWRPRTLKLDILPFLDFDIESMLSVLSGVGLVRRYEAGGKDYGVIDSFTEHQRIGGKEAQEPPKHPEPPRECDVEQQGSDGEATGKHLGLQEGKGREGNRKGIGREGNSLRERTRATDDTENQSDGKPSSSALPRSFMEWRDREEADRFARWFADSLKPESVRGTESELQDWALVWYHLRITDKRENVAEMAEAIQWARGDQFWCRNFLTPTKLRKRDKNGQMFIDRFISEYQQQNERERNGTRKRGITPDQLAGIFDWIDRNPAIPA